ncbi:P-loop containing nucleoside triphosphate hydrolase protein [Eremomyces bilateralis CBS 781.70]|uniref:P-loop containing nucleoside triphosphate hydrolase protein n=1 Tax=Eremomyces bilateralis CBS 781.70 TaxID=1392243 RepID=A0A6G1FZ11_9PEZI|nr:P-loop containing nucleoside triphosphate hydrolase protein [Eremomyces bilateralis CBS 781.70]KAF1811024.1 P-loop containing nucleoside triphosphate hydrolase protein [Eremomyces bilateralis CBS 781.70]
MSVDNVDDKGDDADASIHEEKKEEEEEKGSASLGNYFRVLSYGTGLDYFLVVLAVLSSVGVGVSLPLMQIVFGRLVGDFTAYSTPGNTLTEAAFKKLFTKNSLWFVYLFIGKFVLSYISMLTVRVSGVRISAALRLAYLQALLKQPVSSMDAISPGTVANRITNTSNTIQLGVSQQLTMLVQSIALVVGLYVVSFIYEWRLTLVISSGLLFIILCYGASLPIFLKIHKRTEEMQDLASKVAFEVFSSIRIVVAFGAEKRLAAKHEAVLLKARKNESKNSPVMGFMIMPMFFAMYACFALAFWYGVKLYTNGTVDDLTSIIIVLFSVVFAISAIGRVSTPIIAISKAASGASILFTTIDAEVSDQSGLKAPDVSSENDITMTDIKFAYPSRPTVKILDSLNITFESGKVTAIVGPSGSGKSTTVALLERWYDLGQELPEPPKKGDKKKEGDQGEKSEKKAFKIFGKKNEAATSTEDTNDGSEPPGMNTSDGDERLQVRVNSGSIKIGPHEIRDVDVKWWRAQIGLVQQEPFLFNDTIFNNVSHGLYGTQWENETREKKLELVVEACKEAFADEFISQFPDGYDTIVGDQGMMMSGGQRQRIAIARSIIKRPPILILDEATSAIDVRSERIVQRALDRVSQNRTTIVIAHRLSTIKRADKIVVVRSGKVVEQGTHEELLQFTEGIYHNLVRAQQLAIEDDVPGSDLKEVEAFTGEDLELRRSKSKAESAIRGGAAEEIDLEGEAKYTKQGITKTFGRLLWEQRSHWVLYLFTIVGALGGGAVYPLQAWLFAQLINAFTKFGQELIDEGNFWSLIFFVQSLGVAVAYCMLGWASYEAAVVVSTHYRQEYFVNMITKRISFFDQEGHSPGTLSGRLTTDSTQIMQLLGMEMSMAYIAVFNLIGSLIIAFVFGWKLSLVGLFAILPAILLAGYYRVKLEMQFEQMNAAVFADSSQFATEAVGAFRTVTSLTMEGVVTERYNKLLAGHTIRALKRAIPSSFVFGLSDSVDLACMALAFWYGGQLLATREYDMIQFFVVYMAVVQGSQAAGVWFSMAPNIAQATGAANRIISLRPDQNDSDWIGKRPLSSTDGPIGLEFRDVRYTYNSRNIPVLKGLNMKIEPGQFAALVGASGCGKSTIISLLERFYDVDNGAIIADDQNLNDLAVAEYRAAVSLVSQEPTLYEGTIKENVGLSVEEGRATDADIERACQEAQIHEFVTSLPQGYNTPLGPKGLSLSGGQKQRLSLARALLRQPRLLLLDEATSSLDSSSERLVQEAIERAAGEGGQTIVAVAHRLATIQKADVIFVLGSGNVLEKGNHAELLAKRGLYWQMCRAQALDR